MSSCDLPRPVRRCSVAAVVSFLPDSSIDDLLLFLSTEVLVTSPPVTCQLYLMIESHAQAIAQLAACLDAVAIAAVLVRPVAGEALHATIARSLVELAQSRDVAVLVADDARAARTLRADGVHLSAGPDLPARFEEAREIVGERAMIGVDPGASRHDAMGCAEAGADYIAFGAIESTEDDFDRDGLLGWWSEIFQVPCVALDIRDRDDVAAVAALGVDFAAILIPPASTPTEAAAQLKAYFEAISSSPRVAM
jgi:thiamine-phosphate pyrophosphorylase